MSNPTKETILESISTLIDSATTEDNTVGGTYNLASTYYVVVREGQNVVCDNGPKLGVFKQWGQQIDSEKS